MSAWVQFDLMLEGGTAPVVAAAPVAPVRTTRRAAVGKRPVPGRRTRRIRPSQAILFDDLPTREQFVEEQEVDPPILRSIVRADERKMPQTRAVASVFDLGTARRLSFRSAANDEPTGRQLNVRQVTREAGVVRCTLVRLSETPEGIAKEQARRAKQRPPKPTKKQDFKMRNSRTWDEKQQ